MSHHKNFAKHEALTKLLVCHRCENPLKRESFKNIDDEIFDELCNSSYVNAVNFEKDDRNILLPIFNKKLESSVMRKVILPIKIPDITNDFMIVGELSSLPLENIESLKVTNAVYNLMSDSDNASIDHPVCEECTDNILDQMDSQLKITEDEHKQYTKFLQDFKDNDQDNLEELEAELKALKAKEALLENNLKELEAEGNSVKKVLKNYEEESEILEKREKSQYIEYNKLKRHFLSMDDEERSINKQLIYAQARLTKLTNTNVFSATFHIWHSGHFGTINNFRLGRLPKESVEWTEINAAWGQTVLLLHCLAKKINLNFERYKLVPFGNHSYIVSLDNKTKDLPLYCLGGVKYVLDHRFDHAMVAFLDCLQQFKEKVEGGDDSFHLPYRMDKGKIEDKSSGKSYSVKIHLNSQEQWTRALKFMLTNLKWALAWVSIQFQETNN